MLLLKGSCLPSESDATLGSAFLLEELQGVTVCVKTKGVVLQERRLCGREKEERLWSQRPWFHAQQRSNHRWAREGEKGKDGD